MVKTFTEAEQTYLEILGKQYNNLTELVISDNSTLQECRDELYNIQLIVESMFELKDIKQKLQNNIELASLA